MTGRELITFISQNRLESSEIVLRSDEKFKPKENWRAWIHLDESLITKGNGILIIEHPHINKELK